MGVFSPGDSVTLNYSNAEFAVSPTPSFPLTWSFLPWRFYDLEFLQCWVSPTLSVPLTCEFSNLEILQLRIFPTTRFSNTKFSSDLEFSHLEILQPRISLASSFSNTELSSDLGSVLEKLDVGETQRCRNSRSPDLQVKVHLLVEEFHRTQQQWRNENIILHIHHTMSWRRDYAIILEDEMGVGKVGSPIDPNNPVFEVGIRYAFLSVLWFRPISSTWICRPVLMCYFEVWGRLHIPVIHSH